MDSSGSTRRPSPALILAAIALVVAMAGTAIAQDPVAKITKSKVKSISKKQADKQLKANVAGSHVNTADSATNATNAESANPVAYAHFLANGTIDLDGSKGVAQANMTKGGAPGRYCFKGLSFTPRAGNATVDGGGGTADQYAQIGFPGTDSAFCAAADQAVVFTYNAAGTLTDAGFYVVFYG